MKTVRLRHVAQVNPTTPAFDRLALDDEVTFLPMEAVWPGARLDRSASRKKGAVINGFTRFQNGDVLVPKITPTFEAGRAVLIDGLLNGVGAGTTELHVLRPGPQIDGRFLYYTVNTHAFLKFGKSEMYGVAGQQRVPDRFLRDLRIQLPSLAEQRRIADFLDTETSQVDRLLSARSSQAKLLNDHWHSALSEEIERLASRYGMVRLRHVIRSIEQGWSPQCEDRTVTEGEWGVVKAGCVNGGLFDPAQHKALPSSIQPRREFKLAPGDLLMSRASGSPELIGSTGVVPEIKDNLLLCDKIYRIHIDKRRSSAPFLAYALRSHRTRQHIKMGISGAEGMANNLPTSVVRDCLIPKAPIDVQNAQYKNLDRTRDRTSQARRHIDISIALLTERRQALITAAVTGQFDVSTASGRNTIQGV